MNAKQIMLVDGEKLDAFRCGVCGRIFSHAKDIAEDCCKCAGCGEARKHNEMMYSKWCGKCWPTESARIDRERMNLAVEVEDYDGPVFDGDKYYRNLEEFIEHVTDDEGDELPEFVFACHVRNWTLEPGDIIENLAEQAQLEDGPDFDGLKELDAACKAFNEANKGLTYWDGDYNRKVRVPRATVSA